jgi:hypothetical protein
MRPSLLSEPADAVPSNPGRGLAGTAVFHATLIAALVAAALAGAQLPTLGVMPASAGPEVEMVAPPPPVLIVSGPPIEAVEALPPSGGLATPDGFRYDTSRIRQHRQRLFPFLTGSLPFLDELRAAAAADRQRLRNPLGGGRDARRNNRPPLELSERALDAVVDKSWSRRDRWPSLAPIVALAGRYDADEGRLPAVVRAHVERNLLQPYFEASVPDPRFWVMLGLAADHVDVVEFAGRYAREHRSSRTTTELLFLLDELAEANRAAFDLLMQTNVAGLTHTASSSPQDVQFAWQLQRGYEAWARAQGLDLPAARARYEQVRLDILTTIIETSPGGYGAADARFLAGRLLWDRNDIAGAVGVWRGMTSDERTTYATVRADIRRALRPDGSVDVIPIVRALGAERGRWLRESADRLARFGYTPQRF